MDNFHDCNEALNKTNTLAIKVLQLNLCQYFDTSNWFVDSDVSKRVIGNNELLTNMKDGKGTPKIKTARGTTHQVVRKRTLVILVGKKNEIKEEVLYVHNVNANLLFVGVFTNKGMGMLFNFQKVSLLDSQHNIVRIGSTNLVNRLYKFFVLHELLCGLVVNNNDLIRLWH